MAEDRGLDTLLKQPIRFEYHDCGVARLKLGHSTGWRNLPCLMLALTRSGGSRVTLADGTEYRLADGEMLVLPGGRRHRADVTTDEEVRVWAHVNYYWFDSLDVFSMIEMPSVIDARRASAIGQLIASYSGTAKRFANEPNLLLRSARVNQFGFGLLVLLAPLCRTKVSAEGRLNRIKRFGPVIEYMSRNLSQPLTRDDLAAVACLSSSPFHAAFRDVFGVSPMRFLSTMRMRQAQRLLLADDAAVSRIAESCGYPDQFAFSKAFRKHCGMSPSEYRQAVRLK